ncbi:MAG: helix-turn-helix transcriptional regulator [Evtepia sp.]|uniref:helix-turn-helix domain-containing protein n=1 Tax=Evtepia sp. TaxID=2773933 RepID=UPI002A7554F9|nr:helix-turn-helix transcriptional regulator [Evtepia sp.]MDY3014718.1 helix-turn-helix transcriptional regulator [Evtepia sp.]
MTFDMKAFGMRIRMLRENQKDINRKFTQERLASDLNISIQFLRKLEHGERSPSIELLVEISRYFDVTMDYLILGRIVQSVDIRNDLQNMMEILRAIIASIS